MKVLAARVERDEDDIQLLYKLCGFRSVEEALDQRNCQDLWIGVSRGLLFTS